MYEIWTILRDVIWTHQHCSWGLVSLHCYSSSFGTTWPVTIARNSTRKPALQRASWGVEHGQRKLTESAGLWPKLCKNVDHWGSIWFSMVWIKTKPKCLVETQSIYDIYVNISNYSYIILIHIDQEYRRPMETPTLIHFWLTNVPQDPEPGRGKASFSQRSPSWHQRLGASWDILGPKIGRFPYFQIFQCKCFECLSNSFNFLNSFLCFLDLEDAMIIDGVEGHPF